MKLHRNLAEAVIQSLKLIFHDNRHAHKIIEMMLKSNPKWGSQDRAFIAETIYDIVRWYVFLKEVVSGYDDTLWKVLGAWCIWKKIDLPRWDEFKEMNIPTLQSKLKEDYPIKIKESVPEWLDSLGQNELGHQWSTELHALNQKAKVVVRVNTLKGDRDSVKKKLMDEHVDTYAIDAFPDTLVLTQRRNIVQTEVFKNGLIEIQDAGSQQIAPFLSVEPGMRVIDACAGAGGKTLHLAALMKNQGQIIALDTEKEKLNELKKRARRAHARIIQIRSIRSPGTVASLENSADRLLLDVPCSGLGALRRNPDAKWKLSPTYIERMKSLQKKILEQYTLMVKPGGLFVYATCSILPSENEDLIRVFLESKKDAFQFVNEKNIRPSEGFDGFYMALLKKMK